MNHRVVLTGFGCITPIGNTVEAAWNAAIKGESGTDLATQINRNDYVSKVAAEVKGFDPLQFVSAKQLKNTDRFVQFAIAASQMALKDCGVRVDQEDPYQIGVLIGSGIGGLRVIEEQHKIMLKLLVGIAWPLSRIILRLVFV